MVIFIVLSCIWLLCVLIYFFEAVRGMMYYRRALMLQSYLERRCLGGGYIVFDICYFSNQHLSYIYIYIYLNPCCSIRYWRWKFCSRIYWHSRLWVISWCTGPSRYKIYLCCFLPNIWTTEANKKTRGCRYCSPTAKVILLSSFVVCWMVW